MFPGARIYKTIAAVAIALILSKYVLGLSGFYMTVAVVLSMKTDPQKSYEYGKNRVLGTLLGGLLGYLIMMLVKNSPIQEESILMVLINVGCAYLILWFAKLVHMPENGTTMGCVVFFSITLIRFNQPVFDYVSIRVIETLIGVVIATVVNSIDFKKLIK